MNFESNNSWSQAFRDLRTDVQPTADLTGRVAALALAVDKRNPRQRSPSRNVRFSVGLLAAIAASLAVCVSIFGLKMAFARTLHTVSLNVLAARGYYTRIQFFYQGKSTISMDCWFRDNNSRRDSEMNGVRYTQIQANGKFIDYQFGADHAAAQTIGNDSSNLMNLKSLRAQMQQTLTSSHAENLGKVTVNGRTLLEVAKTEDVRLWPIMQPKPGRILVWIDLDEMLPAALEHQIQEKGKWVTNLRCDFDFEHPVPMSKFDIPHAGVHMDDLNAFGARVGRRFVTPIAQASLGKLVIALRDVQVNRDGDVFILYTNGSTWTDWKKDACLANISDDVGTVYAGTAGALEPFMYHQNPQESRGIVVGKLTMQGACMVPAMPRSATAPRPHTLRLSFEYPDGPTLRHAAFTVPVRYTNASLPGYWAALKTLSLGGDEKMYKLDRYLGRAMFFENNRDWPGLLQATDFALRDGVTDTNVYLSRAKAFENLHQWDKAQDAVSEARKSDRSGLAEDMIDRAEAELREAAKPSGRTLPR